MARKIQISNFDNEQKDEKETIFQRLKNEARKEVLENIEDEIRQKRREAEEEISKMRYVAEQKLKQKEMDMKQKIDEDRENMEQDIVVLNIRTLLMHHLSLVTNAVIL